MKRYFLLLSFLLVTLASAENTIEVIFDEEPVLGEIKEKPGRRIPSRVDVYDGAPLNDVLYAYAKQMHLTYVFNPLVTESVTARIGADQPWSAVEVLAKTYGYKIDRDDNSFRFYRPSSTSKDNLETKVYKTRNLGPKSLADAVKIMLSPVGSVYPDKSSGTVVIREDGNQMGALLRAIEQLDRPDQMVFVEAKLIEYEIDPTRQYGVDWSNALGSSGMTMTVGTSDTLRSILNLGGGGAGPTWAAPTAVAVDVSSFSFIWRFLNSMTRTKIVAEPNILVPNHGDAAVIKGVRQEPVPKFGQMAQTQGGQTTTEIGITGIDYKDIGNVLEIADLHILESGAVRFRVKPSLSSTADTKTITGSTGNLNVQVPVIQLREYASEVIVKDGNVLLLGGIFNGDEQFIDHKIPILGDLPLVGYAFRSHRALKTKRTLLLTLRPTIVDPRRTDQLLSLERTGRQKMVLKPEDYSADQESAPKSTTKPNAHEVSPGRKNGNDFLIGEPPAVSVGDSDLSDRPSVEEVR